MDLDDYSQPLKSLLRFPLENLLLLEEKFSKTDDENDNKVSFRQLKMELTEAFADHHIFQMLDFVFKPTKY